MTLRLIFVRHGLSSFNKEGRIQGRNDLSTLTKEGQLLYNQWGLFIHQLSENEIDVKHFDPELLLQYCVALGVQPDSLKKVVENVEYQHDSSYMWMYHGSTSDIGSVASIVSDIATTGTTVSAAYGGDGGGGAGAGSNRRWRRR